MKKVFGIKRENFYLVLGWVFVLLFFLILFQLKQGVIGSKECPDKVEGSNTSLTIKYFYSPFCIYCWIEKPILKDIVKEKGSLFTLEHYDTRYCKDAVYQYQIIGIPSFIFAAKEKEYGLVGYLPKEKLNEVICTLTGGCDD